MTNYLPYADVYLERERAVFSLPTSFSRARAWSHHYLRIIAHSYVRAAALLFLRFRGKQRSARVCAPTTACYRQILRRTNPANVAFASAISLSVILRLSIITVTRENIVFATFSAVEKNVAEGNARRRGSDFPSPLLNDRFVLLQTRDLVAEILEESASLDAKALPET